MTTKRRTWEGHRQMIEDMAVVLIDKVPELSSDVVCSVTLRAHRFRPDDIAICLDTAREMARAALRDEADLWQRLMR
jgi:hypothetical protein